MEIKKQYSKKERNEIYRKAHEIETDHFFLGACELITTAITGSFHGCDEIVTPETFPELFLFKDNDELLWLDDEDYRSDSFEYRKEKRKIVLMFCEEMTN